MCPVFCKYLLLYHEFGEITKVLVILFDGLVESWHCGNVWKAIIVCAAGASTKNVQQKVMHYEIVFASVALTASPFVP